MSEIKKQEWVEEQNQVDHLIKVVKQKSAKLQKNSQKVSVDVQEIKQTFWNDVTVNFDEFDDILETHYSIRQQAQLLSERERTRGQIDKQLKIMERLKKSPYFGRIDFWEKGEKQAEKIYIGIASLMDLTDENFLIYDWRAPISSMYYDYSPGIAEYKTPGGTFHGEIQLKRQYIIKDAKVKAMFDTGVTIGDEMLQEVLANQADTQMKSIVATIQKEQNRIIRNEKAKRLIVQGVAGSGKTSAALQRVAYLLYRYRDTLNSENIMLFSPNMLFNSYVATVLPELGEENMKQTTFQEYLNSRISRDFYVEDAYDQMEYLLTQTKDQDYSIRMAGIRFKASYEFKQLIDDYEKELQKTGLVFIDIVFKKKMIVPKGKIEEYFYSLDPSISIPNKIELVKDMLRKELKMAMKREKTEQWVEEEIQFLDKEDYLEAFKKLQEKEQFSESSFDDFDREEAFLAEMVVKKRFKPLFALVKKLGFVNLAAIYKNIFRKRVDIPDWGKMGEYTIRKLNEMQMNYEDASPFVYLQALILGRNSDTSIRHVFIDEAQDYSPLQFSYIEQLFPYSKMTLLGDINQAIYSGVTKADTVLGKSQKDEAGMEKIILTKTYRSTKEIVEFSRALIENGELIEPFNRSGNKPSLTIKTDYWEIEKDILDRVSQLKNAGYHTIAIICKTAKESKLAFDLLKNEIPVRLIEKGALTFESGIIIIPSYLAKGIEFDAVLIFDSSQYTRMEESKLFYTTCTRAMHELHLYSISKKNPILDAIPCETYNIL
ncbi:RNA polymerase recycling motor HelD [Pseudoneobacillus sp. C159]